MEGNRAKASIPLGEATLSQFPSYRIIGIDIVFCIFADHAVDVTVAGDRNPTVLLLGKG